MEHFFRFGKQKLLMTAYSTSDVDHEENWFKLTLIAYVNLWAAKKIPFKTVLMDRMTSINNG
jgi:hypothetical protein